MTFGFFFWAKFAKKEVNFNTEATVAGAGLNNAYFHKIIYRWMVNAFSPKYIKAG